MIAGIAPLGEIVLEADPLLESFLTVSKETLSIDFDLSEAGMELVGTEYAVLLTLVDENGSFSEEVNKLIVRFQEPLPVEGEEVADGGGDEEGGELEQDEYGD